MMLAAIQNQEADPLLGLKDNAAPVAVPWPEWVWWCIGIGAVILAALLVALGYWLSKRKPKAIPPTPREIALRGLEELRAKAANTEPYQFSVAVSDVLRTFVSGQYGLKATQQTSPEFLNSLAAAHDFTHQERDLLAKFLDRCDLLKFARITAREEENGELLRAATAFVQGTGQMTGKPEPATNSPASAESNSPGDFATQMSNLARELVEVSSDRALGKLDFSVSSLNLIEEMLDEAAPFVGSMDAGKVTSMVRMFGAYIHEVGRKQFGGKYYWHDGRNQPVLVVGEPTNRIAMLTHDRVRNRLKGAKEDNIPFFFEGFAQDVRTAKPGDDRLHV